MNATPRQPPSFVPTLTEVVDGQSNLAPVPVRSLQDELVQRVMQRVDLVLERRVREAVATVIVQQTQGLLPQLRAEIEAAVMSSVLDALAQPPGRDR